MAKLPDDFPGRAALDEAGEATPAKVRKRVADDSLTKVPGIGEATAEKIKEAFEAFDSPAQQAEESSEIDADENITPASQVAAAAAAGVKADDFIAAEAPIESLNQRIARAIDDQDAASLEELRGELDDAIRDEKNGQTLLNEGGRNAEAEAKGEAEANKTGAQKNQELPNHALDELSPAERARAGVAESTAERIAKSGAVWVDDPSGAYASPTAVRIPDGRDRIKVLPIADKPPVKGMRVKDGDDEYVIQDPFGLDSTAANWLAVRSPNTGRPFIQ